ncbi:MAG: 2-oxoacid:acceptor oxidoreductase family protein, partial [Chloroflexi bacterium]|nr:2-oxoacid:acceptor oxidoreductase family protein [Chloroflexota bacterium]
IGALVVSRPTVAIVMNEPSMARFEPRVRADGLLLVNKSLVEAISQRKDIQTLYVPATDIAAGLGNKDVANVVITGALLASRPVVTLESLRGALRKALQKSHPELLEIDERAIEAGMEHASKEARPGVAPSC